MVLTRATNQPGPDGILGDNPATLGIDEGADDIHEHTNTTTPFVDQNQTYTSTPSHQVFLREYQLNGAGDPVATGKLITNRDLVDGVFGNGNDVDLGGMSTWAVVKAQARDLLGIELSDYDAVNVPMIHADPYGNFIPGPNGFAQLVVGPGDDGILGTADDDVVEGNPAAPISPLAVGAVRTGHMFLADIAHAANPFSSQGVPARRTRRRRRSTVATPAAGFYDDELLDAHFMAGDGRANENIGLTAVHHIFHSEHNRLVEHTKSVILATPHSCSQAARRRQKPSPSSTSGWLSMSLRCRRRTRSCSGTASACSRRPASAPRCSISISCSRSSPARSSRTSTSSSPRKASTPRSIRRSSPSSRTRSTASATRCWTRPSTVSTPTSPPARSA